MAIGNRIKSLREGKNLTQIELASILNVSNSTLSQYESGTRTPSDDMKLKIADFFDVSIDYLLGKDTKKTPATEVASDEEIEALRRLVRQLTPEQQAELLRYGQYLASQSPDQSKR